MQVDGLKLVRAHMDKSSWCDVVRPGPSGDETNMNKGSPQHKNHGPPPKDKMHNIGSTDARKSKQRNVGDGLRMSVTVPKWARNAMRVGANDEIWVRAEANDSDIEYLATFHSNGRSFTLPKNERQLLSLDAGDEVQFWVSGYETANGPEGTSIGEDSEGKAKDEEEEGETLLRYDPPTDAFYHIKDGDTTICGESLDERDHVEISDPGDALAPCPQCNLKSPENMSIKQIVDHLSDKVGFEYNSTNPSYFSKDQLLSILKYINEIEEGQLT